jgi:multiple sugar transport system ATP-binding protein
MAEIQFSKVSKIYADGVRAVSGLDLDIPDGEFIVLVGPSGCGKTTALRMVAGLEEISEGSITVGGRVINEVPAKERDVAMVFQNYALYPHMTVAQNLGFGLKVRRVRRSEIKRRVMDVAKVLGLEEFLERKPRALSGGQRQRVAMGRAIIREPQAFLMDEPLSNLDAKLRVQMRAEIARIQRDLGVTTIYVTHDQTEAMTMGDRVAVMKRSLLQQVASPEELYNQPANLFVGGFIGSPAMNMVEASLARSNGAMLVRFAGNTLELDDSQLGQRPALGAYEGRTVILGIRPESMEDASIVPGASETSRFRTTVDLREALGSDTLVHFRIAAPPVLTEDTRELARDTDEAALDQAQEQAASIFVARLSARSRVKEGDPLDLVVATSELHFFDPETGTAIR